MLLLPVLAWFGYTRLAVAPSARKAAAGTPASVVKTAAAAPAFQSIAVLPLANEGGDQQ